MGSRDVALKYPVCDHPMNCIVNKIFSAWSRRMRTEDGKRCNMSGNSGLYSRRKLAVQCMHEAFHDATFSINVNYSSIAVQLPVSSWHYFFAAMWLEAVSHGREWARRMHTLSSVWSGSNSPDTNQMRSIATLLALNFSIELIKAFARIRWCAPA